MSRQVSRGSAGMYQADERAGVIVIVSVIVNFRHFPHWAYCGWVFHLSCLGLFPSVASSI